MNDPHVVALVYCIKHGDSFDYSKAKPFFLENQAFRRSIEDEVVRFDLSVKDGKARFELRNHYPSIEDAHKALGEYIRVWEVDAQLKHGPDSFCLVLEHGESEIIDRSPTPGLIEIYENAGATLRDSFNLVRGLGKYPAPPSGMAINSDIEAMHHHYMRYKNDPELITNMA